MTEALRVEHLSKTYPNFKLKDISFSLPAGQIMGLIGRNGAGKSTTLKALLNLVHPDRGRILYFDQNLADHELAIKQAVGFADGGLMFYQRKSLRQLLAMTSSFYSNWDQAACQHYLQTFHLQLDQRPAQLSAGMRVKLNLLLALSHRAKLLILDEPTSGLDPISRAELLKTFSRLKQTGMAILFSTHITTDLEACADQITYLRAGRLVASESLPIFLEQARAKGLGKNLTEIMVKTEEGENDDDGLV